MSELFANRYRIKSARMKSWNYASKAMYFVTICTKNRKHYFGEILNAKSNYVPNKSNRNPNKINHVSAILIPTEIGTIAMHEWFKTLELRPDMNLQLGEFVVMPNHVHGIIIIGENEYNSANKSSVKESHLFAPQSKNLASILRGYKSAVTTYARKNHIDFEWQPSFHDHIIRSADAYFRISNYIRNNPNKWMADKFYNTK
jgi:putative transposase